MQVSSVSVTDDEEGSEHVTIELYHTVSLEATAQAREEEHQNSTEVQDHATLWVNFTRIICYLCTCRCNRGQDFERLTLNEQRS